MKLISSDANRTLMKATEGISREKVSAFVCDFNFRITDDLMEIIGITKCLGQSCFSQFPRKRLLWRLRNALTNMSLIKSLWPKLATSWQDVTMIYGQLFMMTHDMKMRNQFPIDYQFYLSFAGRPLHPKAE